MLSEKHLHLDFVVLADDARAGSDQIAGWLGRLDLENNWHVTLVNQPSVRLGSLLLPWHEADVGDGVQSDELAPIFRLLRLLWRAKRCLRRHLSLQFYIILKAL